MKKTFMLLALAVVSAAPFCANAQKFFSVTATPENIGSPGKQSLIKWTCTGIQDVVVCGTNGDTSGALSPNGDYLTNPLSKATTFTVVGYNSSGVKVAAMSRTVYMGPMQTPSLTVELCKVYPNPAKDEITVSLVGTWHAQITDMVGKTVRIFSGVDKASIERNGLPAGTYILTISPEGYQPFVQKILFD